MLGLEECRWREESSFSVGEKAGLKFLEIKTLHSNSGAFRNVCYKAKKQKKIQWRFRMEGRQKEKTSIGKEQDI